MAKFQLIGDQERLSKGPKNAEPHEFKSGKFQYVGDSVPLSDSPVPLQQHKAGIKGGSYQLVGDKVSLSETPHKGWASYSTPISDRAKFASQMPGGKKKG
jgi:hypothetical protein